MNCTISVPINNFIHLLECSPGKDGNIPPQLFHLEVYAYLNKKKDELSEQIASGEQHNSLNENHQFNHYTEEFKQQKRSPIKLKPYNQEINQEINYDKNYVNHKINFHTEYDDYSFKASDRLNERIIDRINEKVNDRSNEKSSDRSIDKSNDKLNEDSKSTKLILIANYTEYSYPTFVLSIVNMNLSGLNLNKLINIDTLHLKIYSSNPKGRSNKISLDFNIGNQTSQLKNLFVQQKNENESS